MDSGLQDQTWRPPKGCKLRIRGLSSPPAARATIATWAARPRPCSSSGSSTSSGSGRHPTRKTSRSPCSASSLRCSAARFAPLRYSLTDRAALATASRSATTSGPRTLAQDRARVVAAPRPGQGAQEGPGAATPESRPRVGHEDHHPGVRRVDGASSLPGRARQRFLL